MNTERTDDRAANRMGAEPQVHVPRRERDLSTRLNSLIGEVNCEISLLLTGSAYLELPREDLTQAVIRCQEAMIATLFCVIELEALDDLDKYSRLWVQEAKQGCSVLKQLRARVLDERCDFEVTDE